MRGEQRVIVAWMRHHMERLGWNPEKWAKEAHLAPTTVSRALAENYESVSSVPTLHALARAAGSPSVLDFLQGQADLKRAYPMMTATLRELLPAVGCNLPGRTVEALAEAIGDVIVGMAEQINGGDPDELARVLARAARAKVRMVIT